jgi:CheY-like chemotaxis protein
MAKILVFDGDAPAQRAMMAALSALGHEAIFSPDGYSVLPLAEKHLPAAFIIAYSPPEIDGLEIMKRLRAVAAFAATPVIFSSATPKFEIEMVVMDAPEVGYIDKPLDAKQLKETIAGFRLAGASAAAAPLPDAPPPAAFSGEPDLDGVRSDIIELD